MVVGFTRAGWLKSIKADFPGFFSLLCFLFANALLFRSLEFALVITASLGFHEIGHAAALSQLGLKSKIAFGILGAWTWSSLKEREKLSQFSNTVVHLAGPSFSLLLSLAALLLHLFWKSNTDHLLILANFSAQVGFLNLLPFGKITDGGKVMHRLAESLPGDARRVVVFLPLAITAAILTLYGSIWLPVIGVPDARPFLLSLFLIGCWLACSLWFEMKQNTEIKPSGAEPLTPLQGYFFILFVWDLLFFSIIVMMITPFWLTPEYVVGTIQNLAIVANLLGLFGS
jgi:hypothetical protein